MGGPSLPQPCSPRQTAPRAHRRGRAPRLARCYDALLERQGLQSGEAILSFAVEADGRLRYGRLERATLGGPGFRRCLRHVASALRPHLPPHRGWAGYEVDLHFGEAAGP